MKIGASACLCGICCRYDGKANTNSVVKKLYDEGKVIPFCPECLGGLDTPRIPSEIRNGRVFNKEGFDNTEFFIKGAIKSLEILRENQIKKVILKEKSPSCGTHFIYDGNFKKNLIPGMGIAANYFKMNGISVISDEKLEKK